MIKKAKIHLVVFMFSATALHMFIYKVVYKILLVMTATQLNNHFYNNKNKDKNNYYSLFKENSGFVL